MKKFFKFIGAAIFLFFALAILSATIFTEVDRVDKNRQAAENNRLPDVVEDTQQPSQKNRMPSIITAAQQFSNELVDIPIEKLLENQPDINQSSIKWTKIGDQQVRASFSFEDPLGETFLVQFNFTVTATRFRDGQVRFDSVKLTSMKTGESKYSKDLGVTLVGLKNEFWLYYVILGYTRPEVEKIMRDAMFGVGYLSQQDSMRLSGYQRIKDALINEKSIELVKSMKLANTNKTLLELLEQNPEIVKTSITWSAWNPMYDSKTVNGEFSFKDPLGEINKVVMVFNVGDDDSVVLDELDLGETSRHYAMKNKNIEFFYKTLINKLPLYYGVFGKKLQKASFWSTESSTYNDIVDAYDKLSSNKVGK